MIYIKTYYTINGREIYRVCENRKVRYCTLDEVRYILSTKEQE